MHQCDGLYPEAGPSLKRSSIQTMQYSTLNHTDHTDVHGEVQSDSRVVNLLKFHAADNIRFASHASCTTTNMYNFIVSVIIDLNLEATRVWKRKHCRARPHALSKKRTSISNSKVKFDTQLPYTICPRRYMCTKRFGHEVGLRG